MEKKVYSIHIGIDQVSKEHYNDLPVLTCCERDAQEFLKISDALKFNTHMLVNEKGTAEHVLKKLEQHSELLNPGDLLWITYSGHGGQKPDLNKDETGDSWDETWCLYDRELIDDELFTAFNKFKKGVRILIFSDSCHSGTVSRAAMESYSGTGDKTWTEFKRAKNAVSRKASFDGCIKRYRDHKAVYDPVLKAKAVDPESIGARVILFAACKDEQECIEYDGNGYFTRLMLESLPKLQDGHTYEALYAMLQDGDMGNQNAQMFGYGGSGFNFVSEFPLSANGKFQRIEPPLKKNAGSLKGPSELLVHEVGNKSRSVPKTLNISARSASGSGNVWDEAYRYHIEEIQKGNAVFVEPNSESIFLIKQEDRGEEAAQNNYLKSWPAPESGPEEFIWHLDEKHSELKKACNAVVEKTGGCDKAAKTIRIAHIDTGYRNHPSTPLFLNKALGRNFINGQNETDTEDIDRTGKLTIEEQGHGCATMAILAGNVVKEGDGYVKYEGYFGAIPFAEVVPIRICETVYNLFNANDVARAINHAIDNGCEVITMSMAGYPTKTVAKAVNRAYENGVVVVTAAGNNWFKGFKRITPDSIMYPARFERVIAATGVCFDGFPYDSKAVRSNDMKMRSPGGEVMQGNWGPDSAMDTALAAYTPNLPWATDEDPNVKYMRNGGGTSSATPQIAAAAALWIVYNRDKIHQHGWDNSWKKVEAARQALFKSASKAYPAYRRYYGNGILRAHKALNSFDFSQQAIDGLQSAAEAHVSFLGIIPFLKQWFRSKGPEDKNAAENPSDEILKEMLSLEILQLIHQDETLFDYSSNVEIEKDSGYEFLKDEEARVEFLNKIKQSPLASDFLKEQIKRIL